MKKLVLGILIGCMFLSGCGSAASKSEMAAAPAYDAGYDNFAAEAVEEYYNYDDADVAMEESSYTTGVTFAKDKKIIYQSNVVLETKTYNETYSRLISLINENGGYIEYENFNNEMRSYLRNNSGKGNIVISTNNMTIRIPSKNYAKFMQEGLTLGNVLNRNQTIQDKTSEYNTNKSYVDILNDEAEYLAKQLAVLENELKEAQANDRHYDEIIENMKDIAERKAQVEKELVPYKRVMDDIDEKVEYSTITMELREVDEFTVIEEEVEEPSFISQIKTSWNKAMTTLGNMLKSTLLFLIAIIPGVVYLLIFGAIAFGIYKLVKKISGVNPKKKETFKLEPLTKPEADKNVNAGNTVKTNVTKPATPQKKPSVLEEALKLDSDKPVLTKPEIKANQDQVKPDGNKKFDRQPKPNRERVKDNKADSKTQVKADNKPQTKVENDKPQSKTEETK